MKNKTPMESIEKDNTFNPHKTGCEEDFPTYFEKLF